MSNNQYNEGDRVEWDWGNGTASGTVQSTFEEKTTRTIDGNEVTRDGTQDDPAVYITREEGNNVLKLASEIRKAS